MVLINSNYYVVISIAFIQLVVLSSLLYQIFKETKRPMEKEQDNAKVSNASSSISQLEFDTHSRNRASNAGIDSLSGSINEDEVRVLSYLLSRGGEAYQAEIARELELPKSTVSRIIRRLHEKGLVTVRRVSRFSYVQVTDIDYVSDLINKSRLNKP